LKPKPKLDQKDKLFKNTAFRIPPLINTSPRLGIEYLYKIRHWRSQHAHRRHLSLRYSTWLPDFTIFAPSYTWQIPRVRSVNA